jgi:hypothetical protein
MERMMERFNLWLTNPTESKILCYGDQSDMEELAAIILDLETALVAAFRVEVRLDSTDSPREDP